MEPGETPEQAAVRESREEVGYYGPIRLVPSLVYVRPPDFKYFNFIGLVPSEFRPVINAEHVRADWFYPERPPYPLHRGTELLLTKAGDQVTRAARGEYE